MTAEFKVMFWMQPGIQPHRELHFSRCDSRWQKRVQDKIWLTNNEKVLDIQDLIDFHLWPRAFQQDQLNPKQISETQQSNKIKLRAGKLNICKTRARQCFQLQSCHVISVHVHQTRALVFSPWAND